MSRLPRSPKHRERLDRRSNQARQASSAQTEALIRAGELRGDDLALGLHPHNVPNIETSMNTSDLLRTISIYEHHRDERTFALRRFIRHQAKTIFSLSSSLASARKAHRERLRDLRGQERYIWKLERKLDLLRLKSEKNSDLPLAEALDEVNKYLDGLSQLKRSDERRDADARRQERQKRHLARSRGRVEFRPVFTADDVEDDDNDSDTFYDTYDAQRSGEGGRGEGNPFGGSDGGSAPRRSERGRSVGTPAQKTASPIKPSAENALLHTAVLDEDVDRALNADCCDIPYYEDALLAGFRDDFDEEADFDSGGPTVLVRDGKETHAETKRRPVDDPVLKEFDKRMRQDAVAEQSARYAAAIKPPMGATEGTKDGWRFSPGCSQPGDRFFRPGGPLDRALKEAANDARESDDVEEERFIAGLFPKLIGEELEEKSRKDTFRENAGEGTRDAANGSQGESVEGASKPTDANRDDMVRELRGLDNDECMFYPT